MLKFLGAIGAVVLTYLLVHAVALAVTHWPPTAGVVAVLAAFAVAAVLAIRAMLDETPVAPAAPVAAAVIGTGLVAGAASGFDGDAGDLVDMAGPVAEIGVDAAADLVDAGGSLLGGLFSLFSDD